MIVKLFFYLSRLQLHSAFKPLLITLIAIMASNGMMLALAQYFGVHRPPFNLDYLLAILLLAFGLRLFAVVLLVVFVLADMLAILGQVFAFVRLQDLLGLVSYAAYASDTYKLMVLALVAGMLLLVLLVYWLGRRSHRAFALFAFNVCAFLLAYQTYSYQDDSRFYRVDPGLTFISQAHFFIQHRLGGFADNVFAAEGGAAPFVGATAVTQSGWDACCTDQPKLLIVNESWGITRDEAINAYLLNLLPVSADGKGNVSFMGATVAAEFKELCNLQPQNFNLRADFPELQQCLAHRMREQGYVTRAIHGAAGNMYDRRHWYPQAGFEQMIFQEDLPMGRRCYSFPGACDIDTLQVVQRFFAEQEKGFLYWLTLNTHAQYDARDIVQDHFDCARFAIGDDEVCRYFKLQAQFFSALGQSIAAGHFDGVDILMVGDHEPRLTDQSLLGEYFIPGKVPWIRLQPGR